MPSAKVVEWSVHAAFCIPGVAVVVRASQAPQHSHTALRGAEGVGGRRWGWWGGGSSTLTRSGAQALMQWEDYHGLGGNANKPYSRTTALPVLPAFATN